MAKFSVDLPRGLLSIDTTKRRVVQRVETVSRRVWNGVVGLTPVRTGSLRASWRIALNVADTSVTTGGSPVAPLGPPAFKFPENFKLGDAVVISNSQPYYKYVENGSPTTKPYGPIRTTLAGVKE